VLVQAEKMCADEGRLGWEEGMQRPTDTAQLKKKSELLNIQKSNQNVPYRAFHPKLNAL